MRAHLILTGLIVASVAASPASANWFSNPNIDINLNIGSAPSPTPDDVLVERLPMLVRDTDGNIIAMIDSASGKIIATAEQQPAAKVKSAITPPVAAKASSR